MTNYLHYKRQLAVLDENNSEIESWITVRGNHIPIKKGQSKEDAVKSFLEKKGGGSGTNRLDELNKKHDKQKGYLVQRPIEELKSKKGWAEAVKMPELYEYTKNEKGDITNAVYGKGNGFVEFTEQGQKYRFPKLTKEDKLWEKARKIVESRYSDDPDPSMGVYRPTDFMTPSEYGKHQEQKEKEIEEEFNKLKNNSEKKSVESGKNSGKFYKNTMSKIRNFKAKSDGTYDFETGKPKDYPDGYSVSFHQNEPDAKGNWKSDYGRYSDEDYDKNVSDMVKETGGELNIGYFAGTPEVSVWVKDFKTAVKMAKKHNQHSVWDWKAGDVWINPDYDPKKNPMKQ